MKNAIFLLALFVALDLQGQTVSKIKLSDIDAEYIKLIPFDRISNRVAIDVDFGQVDETFNMKDRKLMDEEGNVREFNSIIQAINYVCGFGYELLNVYTEGTIGSTYPYYILHRKSVN